MGSLVWVGKGPSSIPTSDTMTTSEIVKNSIQPLLVWILVLTAINLATTGTGIYLMSVRLRPEVNFNLQIPETTSPDQDVPETPEGVGYGYINGKKVM